MFHDSMIAGIRTGVAALVGLLLTWLIGLGVTFPDGSGDQLAGVLALILIGVYNAVVVLLERKVNPMFGLLLGIPRTPVYGSVPKIGASNRPTQP